MMSWAFCTIGRSLLVNQFANKGLRLRFDRGVRSQNPRECAGMSKERC
jgi:hypothetical protein